MRRVRRDLRDEVAEFGWQIVSYFASSRRFKYGSLTSDYGIILVLVLCNVMSQVLDTLD